MPWKNTALVILLMCLIIISNDYKEGHTLHEWYQDDLNTPINTDLKEEF